MKFDDGYAVYLNGQLVHSTNAPSPAIWNSRATGRRLNLLNTLPTVVETTDLSQSLSLLQPGANVLAIHVLNHEADLGAAAGPGYKNRSGDLLGVTWYIRAGKNAFGGAMGLLGKYGGIGKYTITGRTGTYFGTSSWAMVRSGACA